MATSSLQQKMDSELEPSLNLDLSLGGVFSLPKSPDCNASNNEALLPSGHSSNLDTSASSLLQNPHQFVDGMQDIQSHRHPDSLKRRKDLQSEGIRQQKRARGDQEHSIEDHESSFLCSSSLTNSVNHEHSSLQSDIGSASGYDVHLVPSSAGSHSISIELENGDNLDEESTTWKKVAECETPRSRCGSNSDMIGLAATPSTSTIMYTHPFAMVPVQGLLPMPIQWGYTLPYAMQYCSLMMPPNTSTPSCISSSVPDSASGLRPGVLSASCNIEDNLQDNQETSSKRDASTYGLALSTPPQAVSQKEELPPAMVHETFVYNAASTRPLCSTSTMANDSSDVCASSCKPSISLTSPTANYSSDSHKQVDPAKPAFANKVCRSSLLKSRSNPISTIYDGVISCQSLPHKQVDRSKASNSSPFQEGCLKKLHCPQRLNDACPVGNMYGQSKHSALPGRIKPTKTVRFSSDERELVKCISNEDSSSLLSKSGRSCKSPKMGNSCKSQLVNKLQTLGGEVHRIRDNDGITESDTQESDQEEGSANSRITNESSDQGESAALKVGKLEGQHAANLPRVSTTCAGPNGKTIHGVMYITKSKKACLICSCHGTHMSPSEFVQHSGSTDLRNPERSIVVNGFSCV